MAITKFKPVGTGWELAAASVNLAVKNTGSTLIEITDDPTTGIGWVLCDSTPTRKPDEATIVASKIPTGLWMKTSDPSRAELTIWI